MALGAVIRRGDRQPLGTADEVKDELKEAFPGTRFILIRGPHPIESMMMMHPKGLSLVRLLTWLFREKYPHWEGNFEGAEFAAEFKLPVGPVVRKVRVTLYGRGSPNATPYFTKLTKKTGWQLKF
jgi:hypothetical protein